MVFIGILHAELTCPTFTKDVHDLSHAQTFTKMSMICNIADTEVHRRRNERIADMGRK